jgi:CheY-specific phosphatase CheX
MSAPTIDDLAGVVAVSLAEVLSTCVGIEADIRDLGSGDTVRGSDDGIAGSSEQPLFSAMTGAMSLIGGKPGMLFVSASEADVTSLCAAMIGVSEGEVTKADAEDSLCEVVNMTAGSAKLRIGGSHAFTLSSPFVIRGEGVSIATKKRSHVAARALEGGGLSRTRVGVF